MSNEDDEPVIAMTREAGRRSCWCVISSQCTNPGSLDGLCLGTSEGILWMADVHRPGQGLCLIVMYRGSLPRGGCLHLARGSALVLSVAVWVVVSLVCCWHLTVLYFIKALATSHPCSKPRLSPAPYQKLALIAGKRPSSPNQNGIVPVGGAARTAQHVQPGPRLQC